MYLNVFAGRRGLNSNSVLEGRSSELKLQPMEQTEASVETLHEDIPHHAHGNLESRAFLIFDPATP
jgi:hypothetical protein